MGALQYHSPGSGIFEVYFLWVFLPWSKTLLQCLDALKAFVYLTFNMFWLILHFLPFHILYSTLVGQNSMVWVTLLLPQVANHLIENPRSSCDAETTWRHLLPLPCFCGVAIQEAADSSDSVYLPGRDFSLGALISGHGVLNGLTQPGFLALVCFAPTPRYKFVLWWLIS